MKARPATSIPKRSATKCPDQYQNPALRVIQHRNIPLMTVSRVEIKSRAGDDKYLSQLSNPFQAHKEFSRDCLSWYWQNDSQALVKDKIPKPSDFKVLGRKNNRKRQTLKIRLKQNIENQCGERLTCDFAQSEKQSPGSKPMHRKGVFPEGHRNRKAGGSHENLGKTMPNSHFSEYLNESFKIQSVHIGVKKSIPYGRERYTVNLDDKLPPTRKMLFKSMHQRSVTSHFRPREQRPQSHYSGVYNEQPLYDDLFITAK